MFSVAQQGAVRFRISTSSIVLVLVFVIDCLDRLATAIPTDASFSCSPCDCNVFGSKFRHFIHRIGAHTRTNQTVPYGTVLLGPGYDRTVPLGHFSTGL
jgi:hypothetical protein